MADDVYTALYHDAEWRWLAGVVACGRRAAISAVTRRPTSLYMLLYWTTWRDMTHATLPPQSHLPNAAAAAAATATEVAVVESVRRLVVSIE